MAKSELERALERLDELRRDGLLSDSEYEAARRRAILQSGLAAGAPSHEESDHDAAEPVAGDEGGSASGPVGPGRRQVSRRGLWGRFKASRWWVKAIVVVIGLFVLLIVLAAVFGEEEDDTGGAVPAATSEEATQSEVVAETSQPESTPVSTPTNEPTARATAVATPDPTVTPTAPATPDEPGLGDLMEVGSLELTVLEVDTYDAALEDSNYRVRVRVRKLKGDAYDFTGSSFKVIDAGGVAHEHDTSCRDCPGNLFPEGTGIELLGTKAAERWVYFEIRSSDAPVQLRYKPTSRTSAVLIALPSTPRPVVRPSREPAPSTPEPATSTPEPAARSTPEPTPSTPEPATSTPDPEVSEPRVGDPVKVGSLELTVLEVDTYDAALEDSNYRVRVQVRKLKGDAYDFTGSSFKVIDAGGVAHDHDTSCRDCPDNLFPAGVGIELLGTSAAERWVYFEIRSSDAPVQLRYKPTSRTSAVLIALPSVPRPVARPSRETTSTPEPAPSTPEPAATSTPEPARSTPERAPTSTPKPTPSTPEPEAATPVTPASVRDQIEDCLSPWDGNHNGFEDQVRSGLNDEDSMETHSTRFQVADDDGDGYVAIVMEYSAENALGGRVKTVATGLLNYGTCNVTVLDPGY